MSMKRFWFIPYNPPRCIMCTLDHIYLVLDDEDGKGPLRYDPITCKSGVIVATSTDLSGDRRRPVLLNRATRQRLNRYASKLKQYAVEHRLDDDTPLDEVSAHVPFD